MFKIAQSPMFWATVSVEMTAENGSSQIQKFEIQYPRLTTQQLEDMKAATVRDRMVDHEVARDLVKGWRGVAGENGEPLDFNSDNLERLLQIPGVGSRIAMTFFENNARAPGKN